MQLKRLGGAALRTSPRAVIAVLGLWLALVVSWVAGAMPTILDPDDPGPRDSTRALLTAAAPLLQSKTVDVALGSATARQIEEADPVRLARLDGFAPREKSWAALQRPQWTFGFERGLIEAVLAVEPNQTEIGRLQEACASAAISKQEFACTFTEQWVAAPAEKRVFVAFTRDDRGAAQAIRGVLEALGYLAFVYLRDSVEEPWASSQYVGAAFAQAGIRLVVDSPASRGSQGVAFESCAWALAPRISSDDRWTTRILTATRLPNS